MVAIAEPPLGMSPSEAGSEAPCLVEPQRRSRQLNIRRRNVAVILDGDDQLVSAVYLAQRPGCRNANRPNEDRHQCG